MSIFGKIRNAKKAADGHKKSEAVAPVAEPEVKKVYKHVPTHAAQDALSGSSSQLSTAELLAKIKEQRQRMSELPVSQTSGSESYFSKVPPNSTQKRSTADLSITSVMLQQQQEQFEMFQASQFNYSDPKRNPYRFTGGSPSRNRLSKNMSSTSLTRGKSPLSNTISGTFSLNTRIFQMLITCRGGRR
jgi:hypothetical protein